VIDHQTLYPSVPRYIQPVYALEVAIIGVQDVLGPVPIIDQYIHDRYGDVIASNRLALNGAAYCVVFKKWSQALRFLSESFEAFTSTVTLTILTVNNSTAASVPALMPDLPPLAMAPLFVLKR
jgi:hypothetical protein